MAKCVPDDWMPAGPMKRCILHWTAGGPEPSDLDREHYHLIINRKGKLFRGEHAITDNLKTSDGDYAAHTRGCNTGAIGVSLCGMAGACQSPFRPGPYPITRQQWNAAIIACADLCRRYRIPPDRQHLLMHCEVERFLGIAQRGKWDVSVLCHDRGPWGERTPGEELRARVAQLLEENP